jgi:hypothetical protein
VNRIVTVRLRRRRCVRSSGGRAAQRRVRAVGSAAVRGARPDGGERAEHDAGGEPDGAEGGGGDEVVREAGARGAHRQREEGQADGRGEREAPAMLPHERDPISARVIHGSRS